MHALGFMSESLTPALKGLALTSAQTTDFTSAARAEILAQTGLILLAPHLKTPHFSLADICSSCSPFGISSFLPSFQPNPNPSRPDLLSLLFSLGSSRGQTDIPHQHLMHTVGPRLRDQVAGSVLRGEGSLALLG